MKKECYRLVSGRSKYFTIKDYHGIMFSSFLGPNLFFVLYHVMVDDLHLSLVAS
jgi:hypothetical protein